MLKAARLFLILAIFLALPATAQAAVPFTAGNGDNPSVAVGDDGTGHVVWVRDEGDAEVGYCRVSPGGSACNLTSTLDFPGEAANLAGRATVYTPVPNKVVVVASCWNCPIGGNRTFRWISEDNGANFGEAVELGNGFETGGFGAWIEPSLFVAANSNRIKAQDGIDGGDGIDYTSGPLFVYGPEVARVPGLNQLVAATNDLATVEYAVFDGAELTVGLINDKDQWELAKRLVSAEPDNEETALNSGPNGVYLSYLSASVSNPHVGLRRFDPVTKTFGDPVYVDGTDRIDHNGLGHPDSFQDPSGRIHVVWRTLYDGGRLRYTVSDPTGGAFSPPATLAKSASFTEPEIAAGPAGTGFVTWTPGAAGAIRVVAIEPEAESGSATTPPDSTAPGVTGFSIGKRTLRPGERTKFTFRASEAGNAVLTIEKRFNGIKGKPRKAKGKGKPKATCLPLTAKRRRALLRKAGSKAAFRTQLRKKRCRGFRKVGEIRQRVKAGVNTIEFGGTVAGRKLGPGQYRASLVITDSAGNVSRTERLNFKVVGKKKKKKRRGR